MSNETPEYTVSDQDPEVDRLIADQVAAARRVEYWMRVPGVQFFGGTGIRIIQTVDGWAAVDAERVVEALETMCRLGKKATVYHQGRKVGYTTFDGRLKTWRWWYTRSYLGPDGMLVPGTEVAGAVSR